MKRFNRGLFIVSLALVAMAVVGLVFSRYWVNAPQQENATASTNPAESRLVDEQPLVTAQRLAPLASSPEERQFADEALRLADLEVDLAFAAAFRDATKHATPLTPAAAAILKRVQELQSQVKAEQDDIARLKAQLPRTKETDKQAVNDEMQLQQALLEVAQEELDDAQQDLIRAGGDPRSVIQRLQEQHESWHKNPPAQAGAGAAAQNAPPAPDQTNSRSILAQFGAWRQLRTKQHELESARQEVQARRADITRQHEQSEKAANSGSADAPSGAAAASASSSILSTLKQVAEQQKSLAELDKRGQDFAQLDTTYGNWDALVITRQRTFMMGLIESLLWIVGLLILVLSGDALVRAIFSWLDPESRHLHTLRVAARFAIQVIGVALILLVIFGPPSQLATVVALAGAGLTVALKDFIVGFFGWFALMGPNGIRPGDWVEINGVGGEVLEVSPLHTVLLETGSWTDAGHPTGRKVTFVNSFAIEGHYFNFSTSGQWLWDEIQVPIPSMVDPHPVVEAIQKIVTDETQANATLAEKEWQHVVVNAGKRTFSAGPAISLQPTSSGTQVIVRYITRVQEWRDVRSRIYREIVEILRSKELPPSLPNTEAPTALRAPVAAT